MDLWVSLLAVHSTGKMLNGAGAKRGHRGEAMMFYALHFLHTFSA